MVKKVKKKKYITQSELAKIIGISQPAISKMIQDKKIPDTCFDNNKLLRNKTIQFFRNEINKDDNVTDDSDINTLHKKSKYEKTMAEVKKILLHIDKEEKNLVNKQEVNEDAFNTFRKYRDWILSLPAKMSNALYSKLNIDIDINELTIFFESFFKEHLNEISEQIENISKQIDNMESDNNEL